MTKLDEGALEKACRAIAEDHYAKRFGTYPTSDHVKMNVDANWRDFQGDAVRVLRVYLDALPVPADREWNEAELCSDCPPEGYPTEKTRCGPCPRKRPTGSEAGG